MLCRNTWENKWFSFISEIGDYDSIIDTTGAAAGVCLF